MGEHKLLELVSGCCSATGVREDDTKIVGRPGEKIKKKKKKRENAYERITTHFRYD